MSKFNTAGFLSLGCCVIDNVYATLVRDFCERIIEIVHRLDIITVTVGGHNEMW